MGKAKRVILFGISVNFRPFAYWGIPKNMELFRSGTIRFYKQAFSLPYIDKNRPVRSAPGGCCLFT